MFVSRVRITARNLKTKDSQKAEFLVFHREGLLPAEAVVAEHDFTGLAIVEREVLSTRAGCCVQVNGAELARNVKKGDHRGQTETAGIRIEIP